MTLDDLQNKARRKLKDVYRALILGEDIFPLPIPIAKPKTTASLAELRATISLIRSQSCDVLGYGYTVETKTIKSRRHGENRFPTKLSFSTVDDFLKYVGATKEAYRVETNAQRVCQMYPDAALWCTSNIALMKREPEVLEKALLVTDYLRKHPALDCYARQLPIPIPTKFIEQERVLLNSLVESQCPECFVQDEGTLEERVGLRTKESLVEFRSLDPEIDALPFRHSMATAAELADKGSLFTQFKTILVIENHVPFLTAPDLPETLAIMGNGFAVYRLSDVQWLSDKNVFYWGDIDLSGFAILSKLREAHPNVQSALMDQETFNAFESYQQLHDAKQVIEEVALERLNEEEQDMVTTLRTHEGVRLEQEHINSQYVLRNLEKFLIKARDT